MLKRIGVRIFLLISAIFIFSTFVLGQLINEDQPAAVRVPFPRAIANGVSRTQALPVFTDVQDTDITALAAQLLKDAQEAVEKSKKDLNIDPPTALANLRALRQDLIHVTPLLRTYADSLRQDKSNILSYRNSIFTDGERQIQSFFESSQRRLERDKSQLKVLEDQKAASGIAGGTPEIAKKIAVVKETIEERETEVADWDNQKTLAKERDIQANVEVKKYGDEIVKFSAAIKDADNTIRGLDSFLVRIDDLTGDLLNTETLKNTYTNTSTIIFSVLVGGVIVGFFVIAFISEKVRDAIFSGESGIQFVTLFSLVIAIILFGVLKILEGKELAALLGGLSGYILGRGSTQASPSRRGETSAGAVPPPAPNVTPQPGNQQPAAQVPPA